jgi:hypothetical protein
MLDEGSRVPVYHERVRRRWFRDWKCQPQTEPGGG